MFKHILGPKSTISYDLSLYPKANNEKQNDSLSTMLKSIIRSKAEC